MEVHAHTHSPRKKWTHYFWEFLMLFLAVFCGFLAENFREHKIEKIRAKEYATSLIRDLGNDTSSLQRTIKQYKEIVNSFDSISSYVHRGISGKIVKGAFYLYSQIGSISPTVVWADASLIQLTQSGNLRYFRNHELVDKISLYHARQDYVRALGATDKIRRDKTLELKSRVLNNYYYKHYSKVLPLDTLKLPDSLTTGMIPLQSNDVHLLNEYANSFENRRQIINLAVTDTYPKTIDMARELILLLKKEYHLK